MACAPAPAEQLCVLCQLTRRHRRALCRSCYRKLSALGIRLPPRARPGMPAAPIEARLRVWLSRVAPEHRALLLSVLATDPTPDPA